MSSDRDRSAIATGVLVVGLVTCGFAMLPCAALGAERFALPKELAIHATATLALLACLFAGHTAVDRNLAPPLLVMLGLAAVSFAHSDASAWEAARSAGLLASIVIIFLCARRGGRGLAIGGVTAITAIAASAIVEAHGGLALSPLPPAGVIGNRNALAHLVALALPLMIAVACAARYRLARLGAGIALVVAAHALMLTRCRAAWLALALGGLVALIAARHLRLRARPLLGCALALAIGAATAIALPNRLAWSTGSPYRDTLARLVDTDQGSGHGRLVQYRATLAMAAAHPWLGVGPGNWSVRYPDYAAAGDPSYQLSQLFPVNRLPSSDWLGLLATLGAPALLALGWFAARYAAIAIRRRAIPALVTLLMLGVLGAMDTVLGRPAPALVAAIVLGALLPTDPSNPAEPTASTPPGRVLGALLVAVALAFTVQAARYTAAACAYGNGLSRAQLETAARLAPGSLYFPTYLASHLMRHGDCARGAALAATVLADFPQLVTLRDLARACGHRPAT